jgi:hypothetical protein
MTKDRLMEFYLKPDDKKGKRRKLSQNFGIRYC